MTKRHEHIIPLAVYLLFFGLLFLQFPLKGSLPGNTDTWLFVSLFNSMGNDIASFIAGHDSGDSLLPAENIYVYGETAFGIGVIFLLLKQLALGDVVAYYFTLSIMFGLSAFAAYILAGLFTENKLGAFFAGFCFASSNFMFGNMDSPQTVFFFPALFCLYFSIKFLRTGNRKLVYLSMVFGAAQAYCSAYVFLFQCFALGIIALEHAATKRQQSAALPFKTMVAATFLFTLLVLPFFLFYLYKMKQPDFFDPYHRLLLAETQSLNPNDLTRSLPRNLLYAYKPLSPETIFNFRTLLSKFDPSLRNYALDNKERLAYGTLPAPNEEMVFLSTKTCANVGLLLLSLAIIGLICAKRHRLLLLTIGLGGFILSLGPAIIVGETVLPSPLLPIFKTQLGGLFRVPCRAFALCILTLSIFAGQGVSHILQKAKERELPSFLRCALFALFIAIYCLENTPMPFRAFRAAEYAAPYKDYDAFVSSLLPSENTILHLPSSPGAGLSHSYEDLCEWTRECVYMNWQTYHGNNILNGLNGYFPKSRIDLQVELERLPLPSAFAAIERLIAPKKLSYIVFNKWLMLDFARDIQNRSNSDLLLALRNSPKLKKIMETEKMVIFKPTGN